MSSFKKYRSKSKISLLPEEVREEVDQLLLDCSVTYEEISNWLSSEGYKISRSAIGRYAVESKKLSYRLIEAQERVKELVKIAQTNKDDEGLTEAALQMASSMLTEKIALIEEEIDELDAETAINLVVKLSRTKAYKDKIYDGLRNKYEKAFEQFKASVYEELSEYPEVADKLAEIAARTLGKVTE